MYGAMKRSGWDVVLRRVLETGMDPDRWEALEDEFDENPGCTVVRGRAPVFFEYHSYELLFSARPRNHVSDMYWVGLRSPWIYGYFHSDTLE